MWHDKTSKFVALTVLPRDVSPHQLHTDQGHHSDGLRVATGVYGRKYLFVFIFTLS